MTERRSVLATRIQHELGFTRKPGFCDVIGPRATLVASALDGSGTRTTRSQRALPRSKPDTRPDPFPCAAPANSPDRCRTGRLLTPTPPSGRSAG